MPAEGTSSSQSSSYGSRSQEVASSGTDQGTSFRQVMSSYSRSEDDSHREESRKAAKPATNDQKPSSDDASRTNEAAPVADPQPSTQAAAASFTGIFGFRQNGQQPPAAGEETTGDGSAAGGENNTSATPQTGLAAQFSGLSALQALLNGGSVAPLAGNATPAQTPADGLAQELANAAKANGNAAGDTAKPILSKPLGMAFTAPANSKNGKAKTGDPKHASETTGAVTPEVPLLATNVLPIEPANGTEAGGAGEAAKTAAAAGLAIASTTREALHVSAAGQNDTATLAAANNFAFAVRLTAQGTASEHTAANQTAAAGPLSLTSAGQPVMVAAAAGAELSGTGSHAGENGSQGSEQGALAFAAETAPASTTPESAGARAAKESAPAGLSEPELAPASEPVKNVRLQLAGDNNQRVDIRLVDVGGEMRVSVRAGDSKLAQTLQEHIPDLSNRLNQQSVRAEVWSPRTETSAPANNANQGGQSSRGNGGDTPGQGGQQGRQGNGRQQQNQPDWVDELENYSSRTTTTTTRSN